MSFIGEQQQGPDFGPSYKKYKQAKAARIEAIKNDDEQAAFWCAAAMYMAVMEIEALGGVLQQMGVPAKYIGVTTPRMERAQAVLKKHNRWPIQ